MPIDREPLCIIIPYLNRCSVAAAATPREPRESRPATSFVVCPLCPLSAVSIVCSRSSTSVRMLNNISPLRNNGTRCQSPTSSTFYLWHQLKVLLFMLARCSGNFPCPLSPIPFSLSPVSMQLSQVVGQLLLPTFVDPLLLLGASVCVCVWECLCGKFLLSLIVRRGKKFGFVAKLNATCVSFATVSGAAASLRQTSCWRPAKSPWRCKL